MIERSNKTMKKKTAIFLYVLLCFIVLIGTNEVSASVNVDKHK